MQQVVDGVIKEIDERTKKEAIARREFEIHMEKK